MSSAVRSIAAERKQLRRRLVVDLHRAPQFAARFAFVERAQRPDRIAPRRIPRRERPARGEVLERLARQLRAAREVEQILERAAFVQRALDVLALRLAHAAHEVKAQAQCAVGFDEAPPLAGVHLDRPHDDAVPARVVHQHFG